MFHSKEAVIAVAMSLVIGIIVGCAALNIAVDVEVNVIEEELEKKKIENEENSVEEETGEQENAG